MTKILENVYATPTGFKKGTKGKVVPMHEFVKGLSKGERRALRKRCASLGLAKHSRAGVGPS